MRNYSGKFGIVLLFELFNFDTSFLWHSLPQQFLHERLPAHSDAMMNLPLWKHNSGSLQRLRPGKNVMLDAVNERSIKVK